MKKAVIFCASSSKIDPKFAQTAHDVVAAVCEKGYGIVSGGSYRGTMGEVAKTAEECGAPNIGVIPGFMKGWEYPHLTELVWTDTMADRKEKMREGTSLAVALPGGIGTMDELFETIVLKKLGRYDGIIVAYNLDGFYNPLKALLQHFVDTDMMTAEELQMVNFPENIDQFKALI